MIRARFSTKCKSCERTIEEGELIGQVDHEWCCADCVEEHGEDGPD